MMGAESKGTPLPLDLVKCMKCASETEYCLEITGFKPPDENSEEYQEIPTIESVMAEIQKYEGHRKTLGNTIRDKGEKLEIKLKQLYRKLEELRTQKESGTPSLAEEAGQARPKNNGYELRNKRISMQSSPILSCANKQITDNHGHHLVRDPAFDDSVKNFRDLVSTINTGMGMTKGSNNGGVCGGERDKSSLLVSSSSFYKKSPSISQELMMNLKDRKLPAQVDGSIAFSVASGKKKPTPSSQKEESSSFQCVSPGLSKELEKVTSHEFSFSKKRRFSPEKCKKKGSLGTSKDTAMELSDDEDKKEPQDLKPDCKQKDLVNCHYSLRSNTSRREDFKVTYPSGDPEAVEVQQSDMKHLDPYEFLNDTVIDFYIKYLQRPAFLSREKKADFHFFNTFFYKKLLLEKRKRRKGTAYHSKLRKWTKGINLFEKKYLLVPVHDCAHWSLAIVCFPKSCQERLLKPYILHLDSMREGHVSEEVFAILGRYLEAEWSCISALDKFRVIGLKDFVCKRVEVPLQQNAWDCGLFLLYFIECFLRDADDVFEPRLLNSMFGRHWFEPEEASNLRKRLRSILQNLVQDLNEEIVMEDMD